MAGVDGCRGGWAVVVATVAPADADGSVECRHPRLVHSVVALLPDLVDLVESYRSGSVAAIAIDMPIGLLDHHPRAADTAARQLIGPRRSSVFPSPIRATLDAESYEEACTRSRAAVGVALSKQAWHLMPRIRELDRLITAADQAGVAEAHPEAAFARLNDDQGCPDPKTTAPGQAHRRALLERCFDHESLAALVAAGPAAGVPAIDLVDAAANAVTAGRLAAGSARRLGGELDSSGRRAEIVV